MKNLTLGLVTLLMFQAPTLLKAEEKQHPCDFIKERIAAKDPNYGTEDFQSCLKRFPDYKQKHDGVVRREEERQRELDQEADQARIERESKIIVRISGDALKSAEYNFLKLPIVARKIEYGYNGRIDSNKVVTTPDDACKYMGFEKAFKGSEVVGSPDDEKDRFGRSSNQSALVIDKEWFLGSKEQKVAQLYRTSNNRHVLYDDTNGAYMLYKSLTCERKRKKTEPVQKEILEAGYVLNDHSGATETTRVDDSRRSNRSVDDIYVGDSSSRDDFFRPTFSTSK